MQNSLPSGSAITYHVKSPCTTSSEMRRAPTVERERETGRHGSGYSTISLVCMTGVMVV
jgi:hypothetical protein